MKELRDLIAGSSLTKTQVLIGDYVLDHASDVCFMTSTDLASAAGVSEASIIRFTKALGFNGFMDFQKALRSSYQKKVMNISSQITTPSQRVLKRVKLGSDSEYINNHFQNVVNNLEEALLKNTQETYEAAADILEKSRKKFIVATRGNAGLGAYLLLYLSQMLPNVSATDFASTAPMDHMCHLTKDDCVVFISFPRYSSLDRLSAEMAKKSGARIIVITDKPSALLASYADILFTVPVDNNNFFNSLVGAQFIVEELCETLSHQVKGLEKRLQNIDRYISELGIY